MHNCNWCWFLVTAADTTAVNNSLIYGWLPRTAVMEHFRSFHVKHDSISAGSCYDRVVSYVTGPADILLLWVSSFVCFRSRSYLLNPTIEHSFTVLNNTSNPYYFRHYSSTILNLFCRHIYIYKNSHQTTRIQVLWKKCGIVTGGWDGIAAASARDRIVLVSLIPHGLFAPGRWSSHGWEERAKAQQWIIRHRAEKSWRSSGSKRPQTTEDRNRHPNYCSDAEWETERGLES